MLVAAMTTVRPVHLPALLAATLCLAVGLSACGSDDDAVAPAPAGVSGLTAEAERALASTVAITVRRGENTRTGTGTKLADGLIVTDRRLVTDETGAALASISVRDPGGDEHSAIVDGTDALSGLAALRVRGLEAQPSFRSGRDASLGGEVAVAGWISARRAALKPGVVVSAGRSVRREGVALVGLWETNANLGAQAVGAPVVGADGRGAGITTRALDPLTPGSAVVIPARQAAEIGQALRREGRVRRAFLGIESVAVTPARARELRLKTSAGLLLRSTLPGSPASFSELRRPTGSRMIGGRRIPAGGDVIVDIDGTKLTEPEELDAALAKVRPGAEVRLRVIRGDDSRVVTIRTGER